ncbi:drug/metabolite transporter (DMT)-like permease [Geothermobacter ehrlichii]|uniref:Drug/metabolite transporter (DMT)-like permease n=1 Tax=Geothermobacter ehrlichii TaxID=213224 RepID=A0A5D3WKZ5_9BACT|nr:DMT family transporter [Geothermobacter ehrlichii]TYO99058.1 drug/metabolite transporter (DMT)-like permease [Geothermobacter ehrlichii]
MLLTCLKLYGAALFWGGTFVAGRWLGGTTSPVTAAFFRFVVASLALLVLHWRREGPLPRLSPRQAAAVLLLGLTGICAYNLLFFEGLTRIAASRAALIIALNPVAITLGAALMFGEPLSRLRLLGAAISLVGAVVVITRGEPGLLLDVGVGAGELLILGCVLSWTLYSLIGRRAMRGLTPLGAVCWSSVAGTLLLACFALPAGSLLEGARLTAGSWLAIGYLGLFGTVLGFLWYFQGIRALGPARAAVFINFVPVNGVLLATLLLNEPPDSSLLAGGALVLTGAWLAIRPATGTRAKG